MKKIKPVVPALLLALSCMSVAAFGSIHPCSRRVTPPEGCPAPSPTPIVVVPIRPDSHPFAGVAATEEPQNGAPASEAASGISGFLNALIKWLFY